MAAASRSSTGARAPESPARRRLRLAGSGDPAIASPALRTQERLAQLLDAAEPFDEIGARWSPRRTAAFLLVTCGGFWGLVGLGLFRLFR